MARAKRDSFLSSYLEPRKWDTLDALDDFRRARDEQDDAASHRFELQLRNFIGGDPSQYQLLLELLDCRRGCLFRIILLVLEPPHVDLGRCRGGRCWRWYR